MQQRQIAVRCAQQIIAKKTKQTNYSENTEEFNVKQSKIQ